MSSVLSQHCDIYVLQFQKVTMAANIFHELNYWPYALLSRLNSTNEVSQQHQYLPKIERIEREACACVSLLSTTFIQFGIINKEAHHGSSFFFPNTDYSNSLWHASRSAKLDTKSGFCNENWDIYGKWYAEMLHFRHEAAT